mgnify:CR=1 FL=1
MYSECPFCHRRIEGSLINKREVSMLRSTYKICYSLLVPIPFVGSYIGGKLYDIISSSDGWYYRFVCPQCRCSWVSTNNDAEIKIGGNKHLLTFFYRESFVIGSIEDDCYIMQTEEGGLIKNSIIYRDNKSIVISKYTNGISDHGAKSFEKLYLGIGLYIGETYNSKPHDWGVLFSKDGYIWYGKWDEGEKNGIGFMCDFDGSDFKTGYWINNKQMI